MNQKIWMMNHYAGGMFFDRGGRHYNFAKYLRRAGYEPTVFCCNAKHNSKAECHFDDDSLWHEHIAEEIGVPFVFVKARTYIGNGKQRVLNMIDFYRNVKKTAKEYAKAHGKPDVILASSVHPLTLVAGIQLAKHFGVKCICEVRDLWPESIVAYSSRLKKSNPIIKLLYAGEKWIYKKADALIFTMEGAYDYIIEQGWENDIPREKVHHINNGVDLEVFDYNKEHYQIDDPDLEDPNVKRVIYTGSMREANRSITILPEVADELLRKGRTDIQILMYGRGDYAESFKKICEEREVHNLVYKGFVQKNEVPYLLSKAIANILNCDKSEMSQYGSSQNKLFEYLASGHPILSGESDRYSLIINRNCGISKQLNSAEEIADAIIELADHPEKYPDIRSVGEEYDFKRLTEELIRIIEA